MSDQLIPLVTVAMAFSAVAAFVYVMGQYVATEVRVQKRATIPQRKVESGNLFAGVNALVSTYFDEKRFGLEDSYKANLRRELLRAGFFHAQNSSTFFSCVLRRFGGSSDCLSVRALRHGGL